MLASPIGLSFQAL